MFVFLLGAFFMFTLYHAPQIINKATKFKSLVSSFRNKEPKMYFIIAVIKAFMLICKCFCVDLYHSMTSFHTNKYLFIKYVHGGNTHLKISPVKNGPKKSLEYGYIDNVRNDDLLIILAGQQRDFSDCRDALFEFGNEIRYKFMDEDEICMKNEGIDSHLKKNKITENLKKIKKLMWMSGSE